jgi:hypothetical protein
MTSTALATPSRRVKYGEPPWPYVDYSSDHAFDTLPSAPRELWSQSVPDYPRMHVLRLF